VKVAVMKAGGSVEGSVVASDAYFPFRDGLDALAAAGATAVVQPGGSVRDAEVIAAADEHGLAMVFTGKRHFRQYVEEYPMNPAIIVDDINRSGRAIQETVDLVKALGVDVIGIGTIAKFDDAPTEFDGIEAKSLLSFDVNFYGTADEWKNSRSASEAQEESVRF